MKPTPIISGNWKMNKTIGEAVALATELENLVAPANCDVVVFPPATALKAVSDKLAGSNIEVGAQMISSKDSGAFTGQISAGMALDAGCRWALIGHSETRTVGEYAKEEEYVKAHKSAVGEGRLPIETNTTVNEKVKAALAKGLKAVVCVGETDVERGAGRTGVIIEKQVRDGLKGVSSDRLASLAIAYEPRWAIGAGKQPATPEQAQEVHGLIRNVLCEIYGGGIGREVRIMYGGNASPDNISGFMAQPDVNGALVGGASLDAVKFSEMIMKALASGAR